MSTDIFCKVIDNYGDIGVCWRLCKQLAARGETVRLITDDASALEWMTPIRPRLVEIITWDQSEKIERPADLVIESFGCELPDFYIAKMARQATLGKASRWVNLEYLTAERYAEECHLLPSPVMQGTGKGLTKIFFYPGFTNKTGGLLREPNLHERRAAFNKTSWLKAQGIEWRREHDERIVSLFCYEPSALSALLAELQSSDQSTLLLVTAGRASQAVQAVQADIASQAPSDRALRIQYLPYLTQDDYDHLLWASDFNFVRGEDSLVRAIWSGKPFVWQIYPQDDDAHHVKLEAFLDAYLEDADAGAGTQIRAAHRLWNDMDTSQNRPASHILYGLHEWRMVSKARRDAWLELPNLAVQLSNHLAKPYSQTA